MLLAILLTSGSLENADPIVDEIKSSNISDTSTIKAKNIEKSFKSKKLDFTKTNFSKIDFLISKVQIIFIHL